MNGPREFRKKMYGRVPEIDELKEYLKMKLEQLEEGFDDAGSYTFCVGRMQDYVNSWPKIFDEHGGI